MRSISFLVVICVFISLATPNARADDQKDGAAKIVDELRRLELSLKNLEVLGVFRDQESREVFSKDLESLIEAYDAISKGDGDKTGAQRKALAATGDLLRQLVATREKVQEQLVRIARNRNISTELRENLVRVCDQVDKEALDYLAAQLESIANNQPPPSTKSLLAARKECREYIDEVAAILDADIAKLEKEIAVLEKQIDALNEDLKRATDDEEKQRIKGEIARKKAEIEAKKEQIKENKKVKGELDLLKLLSGALGVIVGGIIFVMSSGTLATVGLSIAAGSGAILQDAIKEATGSRTETVIVTRDGELQRKDVFPNKKPTKEQLEKVKSSFPKDWKAVGNDESGNFLIMISPDGSEWAIVQINPELELARIKDESVTVPSNSLGVSSFRDLTSPSKVDLVEARTRLAVDFEATFKGQSHTFGLTETSIGSELFVLSVGK